MFNFVNYGVPYMSGSQTSRNSYRPTQRGFDPFSSFLGEPQPTYYYEPRRTVNHKNPFYEEQYIPTQTPLRSQRASYVPNRRAMNQSMAFEEPRTSQLFDEPRRVQRQQPQQPRVSKQPTQQKPAQRMPQTADTRTRRTRESVPQDEMSFWNMFSADPFFGPSRTPANRANRTAEHFDEEGIVGSSHTPETMEQGPASTKKPQQAKTNTNNENDFMGANMRKEQQKAQPQAKPKASAQPKQAAKEPAQPKIVEISPSKDPKDRVTIEDETPVQQRVVEGKQPSSGLLIEEVNPKQQ